MLPFSAQPESRGRNVEEFVVDAGGDTAGFDNFNLSLDAARLNGGGARPVLVARGDAEWHSAWTCHRSEANRSAARRLAFIVRYVPAGTTVVGGVRGAFGDDYELVGAGAADASPPLGPGPAGGGDVYAPCFGNAARALKK